MLAFATEPVFCSLSNALGNHDNILHPIPKAILRYQLHDVEIRHGLLQVSLKCSQSMKYVLNVYIGDQPGRTDIK